MEKADLKDLHKFVRKHPFPTNILIETHSHCNLRCIMCPYRKLTRKKGKMSFDLWKKIIDEIAEKSPETIIWPALMGEPFLMAEELFEWTRYAKSKGIQTICVNTNLNAFKPEMLDGLLDSGIDRIFVGLDAVTPETYAKIRVQGNYAKVINAIETILAEKNARGLTKPHINLQYIVMDENESEEQQFIDYWKNRDESLFLKIRRRTSWGGGVSPWSKADASGQSKRDLPCTWLLREMVVLWNGDVPQCDGDWDGQYIVGNANDEGIEELWLGKLKQRRDRHMQLDFDYDPCNKCHDWQIGRSITIACGNEKER